MHHKILIYNKILYFNSLTFQYIIKRIYNYNRFYSIVIINKNMIKLKILEFMFMFKVCPSLKNMPKASYGNVKSYTGCVLLMATNG